MNFNFSTDTYKKIHKFTEKNCIYKIFCKDKTIDDFYIGRTTNMKERAKKHYRTSRTDNMSFLYCFIRHNGGIENFDFEVLEKDIEKEQLTEYEKKYILNMKPSLNTMFKRQYKSEVNTKFPSDDDNDYPP